MHDALVSLRGSLGMMNENTLVFYALLAMLAPLVGAVLAGLGHHWIGRRGAHGVTILGVGVAVLCSCQLARAFLVSTHSVINTTVYHWLTVGSLHFQVGLWVDALTVIMMLVVTGVSLLVHIYSMGYMADDDGYARFFSYMSLFTFAMLTLVLANNGLQLFFGWEGVGVVSYLLISFWYEKPTAAAGGFKAFIVNRVGDLGFLLGLAACLGLFGSLDYHVWFQAVALPLSAMIQVPFIGSVPSMNVICLLLFIGAMGKSAQVPLHVWLPESMEGPTPISALIHAATMVTAGVYMVSRLSPLFETSPLTLSVMMVIGATGALFLGLVGVVQNDIKRVVAYSTLSQLGYMIAATGASAYSAGIFHLVTHACFKALLFLGAGSVIMAMHHEQDMTKMGGLQKHLPVTYVTFLIGSLSLAAVPPFAGFFSKDSIIDAVNLSVLPGSGYTSFCLTVGAFVTALYTFRALFMTFWGRSPAGNAVPHESPRTVLVPLIILSVPAVILGALLVHAFFSIQSHVSMTLAQSHRTIEVTQHLHAQTHSILTMIFESFKHLPVLLSFLGMGVAWYAYVKAPHIPAYCARRFYAVYQILCDKYGFDRFYNWLFVRQGMALSQYLSETVDQRWIDHRMVLGVARCVRYLGGLLRLTQTGLVYHYTAYMGIGVLLCIAYGVLWAV